MKERNPRKELEELQDAFELYLNYVDKLMQKIPGRLDTITKGFDPNHGLELEKVLELLEDWNHDLLLLSEVYDQFIPFKLVQTQLEQDIEFLSQTYPQIKSQINLTNESKKRLSEQEQEKQTKHVKEWLEHLYKLFLIIKDKKEKADKKYKEIMEEN